MRYSHRAPTNTVLKMALLPRRLHSNCGEFIPFDTTLAKSASEEKDPSIALSPGVRKGQRVQGCSPPGREMFVSELHRDLPSRPGRRLESQRPCKSGSSEWLSRRAGARHNNLAAGCSERSVSPFAPLSTAAHRSSRQGDSHQFLSSAGSTAIPVPCTA